MTVARTRLASLVATALLAAFALVPVDAACAAGPVHVVLVSIDGFRHDYPDRHPTPNLHRQIARGVRAESLVPAWPTLTFPNHYSIATGLYPAQHGIVANDFPDHARGAWYRVNDRAAVGDGTWYGGEPVWVTAERAGLVTAAFYFVGTEADVGGVRPTHWRAFSKDVPGEARVAQALEWLALPPETRPRLVTLYFEHVDDHAHWTGLASPEAAAAIARVDGWIGQLLDGIEALPHGDQVAVVLVSDHGQRGYEDAPPFVVAEHVAPGDLEGATVIEGGPYAFIHFPARDPARARRMVTAINTAWRHGRAWLPGETPAAWRVEPGPRTPDVIVQADPGYAVLSRPDAAHKITPGDHGWAPSDPAMHGIFLAAGPGLPAGVTVPSVRVVDVRPLILRWLNLDAPPGDGDPEVLADLLDPPGG